MSLCRFKSFLIKTTSQSIWLLEPEMGVLTVHKVIVHFEVISNFLQTANSVLANVHVFQFLFIFRQLCEYYPSCDHHGLNLTHTYVMQSGEIRIVVIFYMNDIFPAMNIMPLSLTRPTLSLFTQRCVCLLAK